MQRLAAAEFLLNSEKFRLEAMYLAGYAVECALKALILARTPKKGHPSLVRTFITEGAKSHRFEYLKAKLGRLGCHMADEVGEGIHRLAWSTDLRYQVGLRKHRETKRFIETANDIVGWVKRSL